MKKIVSIIFSFVLLTLLGIASFSTVNAESTPAYNVTYLGNDKVEPATYPGGSLDMKYKVSNSDENNAIAMTITGNGMGENPIPDSWFTSATADATIVDPKTEGELSITLKVPADAQFGKYTGSIKARMVDYGLPGKVKEKLDASSPGAGVNIGTAIGYEITLSVKDKSEIDILDSALLTATDENAAASSSDSEKSSDGLLDKYWVQMAILILILAILGKIFIFPDNNNKKK